MISADFFTIEDQPPGSDEEQQAELVRRRSYELSVLRDVAQAVNASVDLSSLLVPACSCFPADGRAYAEGGKVRAEDAAWRF